MSIILLTVDWEYIFVVFTSIVPFIFIDPLNISLPTSPITGTDSPVKADLSNVVVPDTITPSKGTLSPGFIINMSPTFTFEGFIISIIPFLSFTFANSGFILINFSIDFFELLTAISWKNSPIL